MSLGFEISQEIKTNVLVFFNIFTLPTSLSPSIPAEINFISKLIKDSNSNDEIRSMQALMLLKYFETRNLIPKDLLP